MELRHLRYFVAVAEQENFRRAAEVLHVSQSPLSRQIQRLEAEMGVALFAPAGRGVRLTAAGRAFLIRCRELLAGVDAAVDEARLVDSGRIGTVTIGFETGTAYFGTLSAIVTAFRAREPRIVLRLLPMSSAEQWSALAAGRIGLGYGFHPPPDDPRDRLPPPDRTSDHLPPPGGALDHLEMNRDRLGLVLPGGHPLAERPEITLHDLRDEPILLQPRDQYPQLHDDVVAAARARDVTLTLRTEPDLEALLTYVACGDALTFLPEAGRRMLDLGSAVWRPVTGLDVRTGDVVMWRAADAGSPLIRPLLAVVHEIRAQAGRDQVEKPVPVPPADGSV